MSEPPCSGSPCLRECVSVVFFVYLVLFKPVQRDDIKFQVPPEHTCQTTPTIASESASRCDSGYGESGASAVDLRCLENARAWCSDRNPPRTTGQCTRAWSREFDGFEQYMHEIFTHRLSIEAKYHVKACLDNQPEVGCGFIFPYAVILLIKRIQ